MDKTLNPFIAGYLWSDKYVGYPRWQQALISLLRYIYVIVDDIAKGDLTLRAMSLVYTTLLSLVPLMAVSFSVLKAFGMHNKQLEPVLLQFLAPMGEQGVEITGKIIGFIDNVKISVLGTFGIVLLFYTAISLIQKIEATFNYVWRLEQHRSIGRRFADYGSVMLIGPLLVFSALGISASVLSGGAMQRMSHMVPGVRELLELVYAVGPLVMIIGAFSFFYMFLPNTNVTVRAGVIGGVVSGLLFQTIGWAFGSVVVSASDSSAYAIYSGFAILVLFMMWMYIAWLILLVGSSVAFYVQHPEYVVPTRRTGGMSIVEQERLALQVMAIIAQRHYQSAKPYTAIDFVSRLRVQIQGVFGVLMALKRARLIAEDSAEPPRYLPGAPLETTSVKQVLDAVRGYGSSPPMAWQPLREPVPGVAEVTANIEQVLDDALANSNIRDMALINIDKDYGKVLDLKEKTDNTIQDK